MSHIKDRLKQYADKYSDCYKYAGVHVKVIQDMIEQLLADLEQDEKENGWIPVSEGLPEDDTTVLVSCKTRNGTTFVRCGYYVCGSWHLNCEGVKAWRPLPGPYKEAEKCV